MGADQIREVRVGARQLLANWEQAVEDVGRGTKRPAGAHRVLKRLEIEFRVVEERASDALAII